MMKLTKAFLATALVIASAIPDNRLLAAEQPLQLSWAQLVPPAPPRPPKSFLAGRSNDMTPSPDLPESRWLSKSTTRPSQSPPEVVATLDGKRVHIGGYIVPLDFDATQVKEFLLVPFVGACIHVPPPPANQIIYVKSAKGFDVKATFDPVYVTGTLTTKIAFTGLAEAGYSLEADLVEARKE